VGRELLDADGRVRRRVPEDLSFLSPCHVLFASDEDLGDEEARVLPALLPLAEIVVVTEGARGGRLYVKGAPSRYPAVRAHEVDPTGAGDVFAAAFLLALAARRSPEEAAGFAAGAAAVAVTGQGPSALPGLSRICYAG
jgi:sugar/nucleoside kinase (ribokinase family)